MIENGKFYDIGGYQTGSLYNGKFYDNNGHLTESIYPGS
jgi:hypothetical protein